MDILDHLGGGGGGEGEDGGIGEDLPDFSDFQIGGAEVVAPLGDAVSLIDGDKTDVHVAEFRLEEVGGKSLGGDVENLHSTEDAVLEGDDNLFAGESRIDGRSADATATEVLDLILHQSDEWRNNHTSAFPCKGRHLECNGFATTGRHQSQRIVTTTYGLDNLALDPAEIIIAPVLAKDFFIFHSSLGWISSICSWTSLRL